MAASRIKLVLSRSISSCLSAPCRQAEVPQYKYYVVVFSSIVVRQLSSLRRYFFQESSQAYYVLRECFANDHESYFGFIQKQSARGIYAIVSLLLRHFLWALYMSNIVQLC